MEIISKYFPDLNSTQAEKFAMLKDLYEDWNAKINVISRQDIGHLYERHVLHSLALAKVISFNPNARILDVGTGGGFPGIPLAIMFPESYFTLIDSIGKKIRVVQSIAESLNLKNINALQTRAEDLHETFDFVVSRAVSFLPDFVKLTAHKFNTQNTHSLNNGILYLKGGNIDDEIALIHKPVKVFLVSDFFEEEFFIEKKIVYIAYN